MTDRAAALTFYAVLSLFPGLLVVVGLVGLLGRYPETTDKLLEIVGQLGPDSAIETFRRPIESIVQNKGGRERSSASASSEPYGPHPVTSVPSCGPRTRSTRCPDNAGSSVPSPCAWASRS